MPPLYRHPFISQIFHFFIFIYLEILIYNYQMVFKFYFPFAIFVTQVYTSSILDSLLQRHRDNQAISKPCSNHQTNICGSRCKNVREFIPDRNVTIKKPLCLIRDLQPTVKTVRASSIESTTKPLKTNTTIFLDGNALFKIRRKRDVSFQNVERFVFQFLRSGRRHKRTFTNDDLEITLHKSSMCHRVPNIVFLSLGLINPIIGLASVLVRGYLEDKNSMDSFSGTLRINKNSLLLVYHLGRRRTDFFQARYECERRGLQMPVPRTELEHNIYSQFVHLAGDLWYGITDRDSEGTWTSIYDPSESLYLNWAPNQPDDYKDGEDFGKARCDLHINDVPSHHKLAVLCVRQVNIKASEVEQTRFTPDAFLNSLSLGECLPFPQKRPPGPNRLTMGHSCDQIYLKVVRRPQMSEAIKNCHYYPPPSNSYSCLKWKTPLILNDMAQARQLYRSRDFITKNYSLPTSSDYWSLYHQVELSSNLSFPDIVATVSTWPCLAHHLMAAENFTNLISEGRPDEVLLIHGLDVLNNCHIGPLSRFRQNLTKKVLSEIGNLCSLNETRIALGRLTDLVYDPKDQIDPVVEYIKIYRFIQIALTDLSNHEFKRNYNKFDLSRNAQNAIITKLGTRVTIDQSLDMATAKKLMTSYKELDFTSLATIFSGSSS